jgi:hypothetical protein
MAQWLYAKPAFSLPAARIRGARIRVKCRMANSPTTCPFCDTWVTPERDGRCPSCLGLIIDLRRPEHDNSGIRIVITPDPNSSPFALPSLERRRLEDDARNLTRALRFRRARGTSVIAGGAVLANAVRLTVVGENVQVIAQESMTTLFYGLIVGPFLVVVFSLVIFLRTPAYRAAREGSSGQPHAMSVLLNPWRFWRFVLYACPAFFAALPGMPAGKWSWPAFEIAATGSVIAGLLLVAFRHRFGGESLID